MKIGDSIEVYVIGPSDEKDLFFYGLKGEDHTYGTTGDLLSARLCLSRDEADDFEQRLTQLIISRTQKQPRFRHARIRLEAHLF